MVISKKITLALRFKLNEQQKVKFVCGFGTDRYGKLWACDSADWCSVLLKVNIFQYFICIAQNFKC
jgi:hypothetical protein